METIRKSLAPEYISKAYCEAGDIYREDQNRRSDFPVTDYYENMDAEDSQNYSGLYRCALMYEEKASTNARWLKNAKEKYDQVLKLIEEIKPEYRTLQEFEFFYKAIFGSINMAVLIDQKNRVLNKDRKILYRDQLKKLMVECMDFNHVIFLQKMYNNKEELIKIQSFMHEKMSKVHDWAESLVCAIA